MYLNICQTQQMTRVVAYFRYDPDLARFEDPPSVTRTDNETAFKFCPSCVRIQQKELVCDDRRCW